MIKILFVCHGRRCVFNGDPLDQVDYEIRQAIFTTGLQLLKDVPI